MELHKILAAVNLLLLAALLYYLWFVYLPRFEGTEYYRGARFVTTLVTISFTVAAIVALYLVFRGGGEAGGSLLEEMLED